MDIISVFETEGGSSILSGPAIILVFNIKYTHNVIYKVTMLHFVQSFSDNIIELLKEDPVRPHIPTSSRIGANRDIFVLRDENGKAKAITCASYQNIIPLDESELFEPVTEPSVVVFYTIWSYAPGAGRELILDAVRHIRENKPNIKRFVTLSPPTEMARKFHIKNGANTFRVNDSTINYEYI